MNSCFLKIDGITDDNTTSDTLIVTFAGYDRAFGGINRFEFVNYLEKHFHNISRHFYIDTYSKSYHKGIYGISTNIDETLVHLQGEIKNYKNIYFIGVSSGGYAAILFGSILNVTGVMAFIPQTILRSKIHVDEKYRDISKYINNTTKYHIYGNTSVQGIYDSHHISHCERIAHHSNVFLTKNKEFDLKKLRDNGELFSIFQKLMA